MLGRELLTDSFSTLRKVSKSLLVQGKEFTTRLQTFQKRIGNEGVAVRLLFSVPLSMLLYVNSK